MKSEERHELETNSLAKLLTEGGEKLGPYASYIIYGLLAVVAVWAIVSLTTGKMRNQKNQAWDAYTIATLPGKYDSNALRAAAEEYGDRPVGELADISWADGQLADGCRACFMNKSQATELLDAAANTYERLTKTSKDPVLKSRAQLGLAKTLEAKGEIKEAIAAYEKVTGTFEEMAKARVEYLNEVGAPEYGDWLARAEGARRAPNMGGGMPGFSPDALGLPQDDAAARQDQTEALFNQLQQYQDLAPDAPKGNRYDEAATEEETPKADPFADITAPDAATEAPAGEEAAMEESAAEEPAAEEPMTEESVTEEAVVEEPATEAAAAETSIEESKED